MRNVGCRPILAQGSVTEGRSMEAQAFSVSEFCRAYRIGRDKFYDHVRKGRLRAIKDGKRTLILRTDAEKWADALPALELK